MTEMRDTQDPGLGRGAPDPSSEPGPSTVAPAGPARRAPRRRRFDARRDGGRVLLVVAVVLLLDLAFWFWVVRPRQEHIDRLTSQKVTADATYAQQAHKLERLREVHAHVRKMEEDIRTFLDDYLSTKRQRSARFQAAIFNVGRKYRVAPESATPTRQDLEQEGIESTAWSFPVEGGYENLRKMLADLEALDQFVIVREIRLGSGREGGNRLQLGITVETFFSAPGLRERLERERRGDGDRRSRRGGSSRDRRRRGGRT